MLRVLALCCLALPGCASTAIEATDIPPSQLSLTLYTRTNTQRLTYFELNRSGELRYAGGLAAMRQEGEPVTTITQQQKQEIWNILIDGKLHEAGAGPLFPEAKAVNYDLAFNTGGFDRIVRSVDDEYPALKILHDYLFKLQTDIRYANPILTP